MFGYIKTYQSELKVGELEHYRGVYCALCRRLGKRYGLLAQWSLSYDLTFLAMMRLALNDACGGFKTVRCPYNPFKKRACSCDTEQLDAVADAAVLLTYHKLKDTVADSRFLKRFAARCLLPLAARDRRRCGKIHPDWDEAVERQMNAQAALEQDGCASVDASAQPTAKLLELFFAEITQDEKERRVLSRFGYCLGRWVYLMDAIDDLPEDRKQRNYNPFLFCEDDAAARERAKGSLNASLAECKVAYELLNIRRFDGILRNILEQGMPAVQQQVLQGEKRK